MKIKGNVPMFVNDILSYYNAYSPSTTQMVKLLYLLDPQVSIYCLQHGVSFTWRPWHSSFLQMRGISFFSLSSTNILRSSAVSFDCLIKLRSVNFYQNYQWKTVYIQSNFQNFSNSFFLHEKDFLFSLVGFKVNLL